MDKINIRRIKLITDLDRSFRSSLQLHRKRYLVIRRLDFYRRDFQFVVRDCKLCRKIRCACSLCNIRVNTDLFVVGNKHVMINTSINRISVKPVRRKVQIAGNNLNFFVFLDVDNRRLRNRKEVNKLRVGTKSVTAVIRLVVSTESRRRNSDKSSAFVFRYLIADFLFSRRGLDKSGNLSRFAERFHKRGRYVNNLIRRRNFVLFKIQERVVQCRKCICRRNPSFCGCLFTSMRRKSRKRICVDFGNNNRSGNFSHCIPDKKSAALFIVKIFDRERSRSILRKSKCFPLHLRTRLLVSKPGRTVKLRAGRSNPNLIFIIIVSVVVRQTAKLHFCDLNRFGADKFYSLICRVKNRRNRILFVNFIKKLIAVLGNQTNRIYCVHFRFLL